MQSLEFVAFVVVVLFALTIYRTQTINRRKKESTTEGYNPNAISEEYIEEFRRRGVKTSYFS